MGMLPTFLDAWLKDRRLRGDAEVHAARAREDFASVDSFALFVGPPRSGSAVSARIVNAHPEIIVSRGLDAPERVRRGWDRDTLFGGVLARDAQLAALDDSWIDSDFDDAGSFPGDYQHLSVLGDKTSGISTNSILRDASLWDRFMDVVGVQVRVVQNTRNPFDTIVRIADGGDLRAATSVYFDQLIAIRVLEQRCGSDAHHVVPIEDLVAVPDLTIREMCSFLQVEAPEDFVEAAIRGLVGSAARAREEVEWPDGLVAEIETTMAVFPQLSRYRFDV